MSKSTPVVNTASGKFQDLYTALNSVITTLNTEIVTANSSAAGGLTVGNVMISGTIGAITIAANNFRGGTVAVPAPLNISSNIALTNTSIISVGNTIINSTAVAVGANVVLNASSLWLGNAASIMFAGNNSTFINSTALLVGNSTVFGLVNSSALFVQNTTSTTLISPGGISVGNSVVNAAFGANGVDPADLTFITFGDATANTYANSTIIRIANTLSSATLRPTSLTVGSIVLGTTNISVGNSVSNLVINSSGVAIDGVPGGAFTTGDAKITLKTVADISWVMMNDGTIGDGTSAATARANNDCQALFILLWTNIADAYAPVTGGRGASAAADWAAHKKISLTRVLGRALAVAGTGAGLTGRQLGGWLGEETHAQTVAEMPSHGHTITDPSHNHTLNDPTHAHSLSDPGHGHGVGDPSHAHGLDGMILLNGSDSMFGGMVAPSAYVPESVNRYVGVITAYAGTGIWIGGAGTGQGVYGNYTGTYNSAAATGIVINPIGSSTPFNVMQPTSFWNIMIKL